MIDSRPTLSSPAEPRRGATLLIIVAVLLLTGLGAALLAYYLLREGGDSSGGQLTALVERKEFVHDVVEAGEVESSENVEVRCEVKSRNSAGVTILDVVPEGTFVRGPHINEQGEEVPGDILVTLDSSGLELEKQQEEIILNNKVAARDQALNLLIAAISALKEYVGEEEFRARFLDELTEKLGDEAEEVLAAIQATNQGESKKGTFHVEEQGYQAELFLAEENLRKAEQYFRYSESLAAQGYVTEQQLKSDEFAVEKAHKDRDAAQTKLDVLRIHTKKKTEKALTGDIYNALSVYRAEKSSVQVQKDRVDEITAQIEKCVIRAPQDGQVVHANERDRRGNDDFVVEPGVAVRERQVLIRLPNSDKMQVEAKISESKISLVEAGMKATVSIDAFDDMTLDGAVTHVNQYPEPTSWFSSTVKEYVTKVQILNPPPELKSGLTAKVRIHAQRIPDARQVPIQSVHRHQGRYYCFVKEEDGWRPQQVSLGASNEKQVVVKDGLEEGQVVAMNPGVLLDDVDLPQLPAAGGEPGEEMLAGDEDASESKYVVQRDVVQRDGPSASEDESGSASRAAQPDAQRRAPGGNPSASGGPGSGAPPSPGAIASAIFSRSDSNNDGKLTEDELPERFRGNFSATDTNGDGGIDRAEMTAAMSKRMQNRRDGGPTGAGE